MATQTQTGALRLLDSADANYVGLQGPSTQSASVTYTLPTAPTTSGQVLTSTTGGTMSWNATGGLSLAAVGASPNADAATLAAGVLTLQPSNASFPGVVTTAAQTVAGTKTFSSPVTLLDTGDANVVALQAPSTQTASTTYTLPTAPTSTGLVLTSTTGGVMSWAANGNLSLAAVGASPNADAATLSAEVLTLQPANASFPGVVTTAAQSIAGTKTFSAPVTLLDTGDANVIALQAPSTQTASTTYTFPTAPTSTGLVLTSTTGGVMSWAANGNLSLAAVGASPNADAATLSAEVLTLQPCNGSNPGVVTTGAQTIAGTKTFTSSVIVPQASVSAPGLTFASETGDGMYWNTSASAPAITSGGADRLIVYHQKTGLTNNASNNVISLSGFGTNATAGLIVDFLLEASDGTHFQSAVGTVCLAAAQVSGTANGSVLVNYVPYATSGTLTTTWAVSSGSGSVTLTLTPASSLTTTVLQISTTVSARNNSANTIAFL